MAKKGVLTTTSPIKWNDFLNLIARMLLDLESINSDSKRKSHARFILLISIGCYTGFRLSDIRSLTWEDLIEKRILIIVEKKTGKVRNISLNPKLISMIEKLYLIILPDRINEFVFSSSLYSKAMSTQFVNRKLKGIFEQYKIRVM